MEFRVVNTPRKMKLPSGIGREGEDKGGTRAFWCNRPQKRNPRKSSPRTTKKRKSKERKEMEKLGGRRRGGSCVSTLVHVALTFPQKKKRGRGVTTN